MLPVLIFVIIKHIQTGTFTKKRLFVHKQQIILSCESVICKFNTPNANRLTIIKQEINPKKKQIIILSLIFNIIN